MKYLIYFASALLWITPALAFADAGVLLNTTINIGYVVTTGISGTQITVQTPACIVYKISDATAGVGTTTVTAVGSDQAAMDFTNATCIGGHTYDLNTIGFADGQYLYREVLGTVSHYFWFTIYQGGAYMDGEWSGNTPYVEGSASTTQIINVSPRSSETVSTSTQTVFQTVWGISTQDYSSGMSVEMRIIPYSSLNPAANGGFGGTTLGKQPYSVRFVPTGAGIHSAFSYVDTTDPTQWPAGRYLMTTSIYKQGVLNTANIVSGSGVQDTIVSSSTYFILGTSSPFDLLSPSATSTCGLLSFMSCLDWLIVPQPNDFSKALGDLQNSVFGVWPFGYALRFYAIIVSASSSQSTANIASLPQLSFTLPHFLPSTSGQTINLTPWYLLMGTSSMLSTAVNTDTGHNLKYILNGNGTAFTWDNFVYVLFTLWIASRVFKVAMSRGAGFFTSSKSQWKGLHSSV